MKARRRIKKALLLSVLYLMVNSFSCKSRGYSVKNCTNDTLFFEISELDTLEGYTYMDEHVFDSIRIAPEDTMVCI